MINIILVEDDIKTQKDIKDIIAKIEIQRNIEMKLQPFSQYNSSLEVEIKNNHDFKIYILDIELPHSVSGIEIAKKIREKDIDSAIIFITSHDFMFERVFRSVYGVFDFIEKYDSLSTRLYKDLTKIILQKQDQKKFIYKHSNKEICIYYKNILYIESNHRKLLIHTDFSIIEINLTLEKVQELLDNRFLQTSKSCIINQDRAITKEWNKKYITFDNQETIYLISKKYQPEANEI